MTRFSALTAPLRRRLTQFRKKTDGAATVEFAIMAPVMFIILFSAVELGILNMRQVLLDRALDLTVRDIRLGTGTDMQHDQIRNRICERAGIGEECDTALKLEMVQLDPRDWTPVNSRPDCVDTIERVDAVNHFNNGQSNELMFLRACLKFSPVMPHIGLGNMLVTDAEGRTSIFSSSAFVQEPK